MNLLYITYVGQQVNFAQLLHTAQYLMATSKCQKIQHYFFQDGTNLEILLRACLFICPLARKSSIRISHSKKVQQQNLPQQNSPVPQSPTAKKSSSRISHLKIVQYHNLPHPVPIFPNTTVTKCYTVNFRFKEDFNLQINLHKSFFLIPVLKLTT